MVKGAMFHSERDAICTVLFSQTLHAYMYYHCGGEFGGKVDKVKIDEYAELANFMLSCLVKYRENGLILWSAACNLTSLCMVDERSILHVERWGRVKVQTEEDDAGGSGGGGDEDSVTVDDGSISGGKLDGCKLIVKGMQENMDNVHLQEQYCRLIICMSKQLDARMSLLRSDAFDVLKGNTEELKRRGSKDIGGFLRLSMNAQLALETGQQFS